MTQPVRSALEDLAYRRDNPPETIYLVVPHLRVFESRVAAAEWAGLETSYGRVVSYRLDPANDHKAVKIEKL